MKVLSNPVLVRLAFALFISGFVCVVGILLLRSLRRMFTAGESLDGARPEPEQFPMHAYNAVIQQLKQQKHELTTAQQAERRRAKTSENISAAVLSRLPSGVMFFGTNGLVRQANSAARKILGFASLAGMSADEMIASIRTNNLARLTLIPGVGRKTAERLVMELRDKVTALTTTEIEEEPGVISGEPASQSEDSMRSDALSALLNLGYQRSAAEKAITSAMSEEGEVSVESLLRSSLRKLAKA